MADRLLVYFGVRYTLPSDADVSALEDRTDPRLRSARKAKLRSWWGQLTAGSEYFLLIGAEIGQFGVEGDFHRAISTTELQAIMDQTTHRLADAGITEAPALHVQFQ